ncbi:MAG: hypothetical protein K2J10_01995 [Muribaculaceae bacterium]|nr:hypothetical protein [Muribaculaceae bacterium]
MKNNSSGKSLTVLILAVALLTILSVVDWHMLTGGRISNFSLIEDICYVNDTISTEMQSQPGADLIDPALVAAMDEVTSEVELPIHEVHPNKPINTPVKPAVTTDTIDTLLYEPQPAPKVALISPKKVNGVLPIEDYTPDGSGLRRFAEAIDRRSGRRARIAVIGDSYIEGDIFTQDIRSMLQSEYGGKGVGYMSMHSDFPGFRRSVNQSDKGWTVIDMRNNSKDEIKPLSGEYCIGSVGSVVTFKGSKLDHADKWTSTNLIFIAPADGIIKVTTDQGVQDVSVEKSDDIQSIKIEAETTKITLSSQINGLKVLGAWLEDDFGVGVDCMSLRGNSGVTHRALSVKTAREMNEYVPYDLIVVEYGLNALSAQQSNYTSYSKLMAQVIDRIKECYPSADILMLGVGDRGHKKGSSVSSMTTVEAMISAQRNCARDCGIMFWDTREAMGGVDAIVDWRQRGLVNADYIHLNHKGGGELAKEFVKALKLKINETL